MIGPLRKLAESRTAPLLPYAGLGVYVATSVVYLFESGTPQPADYVLVLTMVTSLLLVWPYLPSEPKLYLALAVFLCWIVVVNACWHLITGETAFFRKTIFYFYNALVLVFVVMAGAKNWDRLKRTVWWGLMVSLVIELLHLALVPEEARRAVGSFNNPNQLGYWALLLMACLGVCKGRSKLGPGDLLILGGAFYVIMLSLSKAASISGMVLILFILVTRGFRFSSLALGVCVLAIVISVQLGVGGLGRHFASLDPVAAFTDRLGSIGEQKDDSVTARGYARILENPHLLAFGAGEGAFDRFSEEGNELHSTPGNILFSYGFVGLGLFIFLLATVFSRVPLASLLYMGPIMAYSLTHMGLRFSLLWIFFGLVYAQARYGRGDVVELPVQAGDGAGPRPAPVPATAPIASESIADGWSADARDEAPAAAAPQAGRNAASPGPGWLPSARQ